jgi:predicted nucleotidyltransferase component of viral defense system
MNQLYLDTAKLLTQVAPLVFQEGLFALKGGTAINLFLRDIPRLSVDLDLVFPDYTLPRTEALVQINNTIRTAAERLMARGFTTRTVSAADAGETKILVRRGSIEVKVEVNFVLRGTVYPGRTASLAPAAREALLADLELRVVSVEDLYGGKLVAALDRQHPRYLFVCMQLFAHEEITPTIRRAFVVYLASHNRPVHEVLFPNLRDIGYEYERTFKGMTTEPVAIGDLEAARARVVSELQEGLDANETQFLVKFIRNEPEWELLGIPHLAQLRGSSGSCTTWSG